MLRSAIVILGAAVAFAAAADTLSVRATLGPLGGDGTRPLLANNAFSFPMANIAKDHVRVFSFGNRLFNTNWVEAPGSVKSFDGLGPLFNRVSCSGCHTKDGRGAPPDNGQGPFDTMLIRLSLDGEDFINGVPPVPNYGTQLSDRSLFGVPPEGVANITWTEQPGAYGDGEKYSLRVPMYEITELAYGPLDGVLISPRVAPQMIGLGLLGAVPDEALRALADPLDSDGDGVSGRVQIVEDGKIGRFGWKAGAPDLKAQNAAAAIGDIGLTTSLHPNENCAEVQIDCRARPDGGAPEISDEFLDKLTLYTSTLAVPAQRDADNPEVQRGLEVFVALGCPACHLTTLETGSSDLPEVANQTVHPFTDLLLHDMGEGLADNRSEWQADEQEWRTPPLWGLGLVPLVNGHSLLLHDGRARGFAEAVLWHGGEGEAARDAFRTAPKPDREALVAFLNSL
jgi:CxxC motif-containing protein (DUF1111 family)